MGPAFLKNHPLSFSKIVYLK